MIAQLSGQDNGQTATCRGERTAEYCLVGFENDRRIATLQIAFTSVNFRCQIDNYLMLYTSGRSATARLETCGPRDQQLCWLALPLAKNLSPKPLKNPRPPHVGGDKSEQKSNFNEPSCFLLRAIRKLHAIDMATPFLIRKML